MLVKDLKTKSVTYVEPATTAQEAAQIMKEKDCGFLAVGSEKEGTLSGVLTDRDIVTRCVAQGLKPNETEVGKIQTSKVLYCFDKDSIEDATSNMRENQIYRLIVLNNKEDKQLSGVITLGDVVRSAEMTHLAEKAAKGISAQHQAA